MKKEIFKDNLGNIHFGVNFPAGYQNGTREDISNALKDLGDRKLWRCTVCDDLRISAEPLEDCPTCSAENAYVEIELNEFRQLMDIL